MSNFFIILLSWDKKYFILRKEKIYFYSSREAEKAEGSFDFIEIAGSEPHPQESLQFILVATKFIRILKIFEIEI